jgi:hypothetical protein
MEYIMSTEDDTFPDIDDIQNEEREEKVRKKEGIRQIDRSKREEEDKGEAFDHPRKTGGGNVSEEIERWEKIRREADHTETRIAPGQGKCWEEAYVCDGSEYHLIARVKCKNGNHPPGTDTCPEEMGDIVYIDEDPPPKTISAIQTWM